MQSIGELLKHSLECKRPKSKRAVIIQEIATRLKKEREPFYFKDNKKIKLKPLTDRQIAIRVGHYNEEQLLDLLEVCKHSKDFTKSFWYFTKVTKI